MKFALLVAVAVLAAGAAGCGGCCSKSSSAAKPTPTDKEPAALAVATADQTTETAVDLLQELPRCEVYHRGILIDLGSPAADGRLDFNVTQQADVQNVLLGGATWARVLGRKLSLSFYLDHPTAVFIEGRFRSLGIRSSTVRIDGHAIAPIYFPKGEIKVARTPVTTDVLEAGTHVVTFELNGARRNAPNIEVDWVRIGEPDNDTSTYAPPTLRDLSIETTVGKRPLRALALRAPGSVRCAVGIREGMTFRSTLGYTGAGEAQAQILLTEVGKDPIVLHTAKLQGEEGAGPVELDLSLDSFAGKSVILEIAATQASAGGKILFGEPALRVPKVLVPPRTKAKVAVVLLLSSAERKQLPPYEEVPALSTLTDLAAASVIYQHHRAPSSLSAGSVASLLTGLGPTEHTVMDGGARLPARFATLATVARDGRVTTAMFTGNPGTFDAFGFNRGWNHYQAFSPVSGVSARAPIKEATRWLEEQIKGGNDSPMLLLIHARGAHPPWPATPEELHALPPEEYSGPIDSRRAAEVLAKARNTRRYHISLSAPDRQRIDGFCSLALAAEDQALSELIQLLKKTKLWDSTLLVVSSDIGMGRAPRVPFGDGEKLGEDVLELPLVIRYPGQPLAGKTVAAPSTAQDLARTVLSALELKAPDSLPGRDLFEVAQHPGRFLLEIQPATLGPNYSTRWGDLVLEGISPKAPTLCDLTAPDGCVTDLRDKFPFVAAFLWRSTYGQYRAAEAMMATGSLREPATIDPDTASALTVWGNQEAK